MNRLPIERGHRLHLFNCLLVVCLLALGSENLRAEIRFAPAQEGAVWVGEKLELNLELWSTGFSFGDQLFTLPEVTGGYLMQADSTTVKLSESRDGVQWQGLSYTFLFYPQRAGRLEVPSFRVQFSSGTGYGSEPTFFDYRTPTLYIDARLPPGADPGSLIVTTDSFDMTASWTPELPQDGPVELKVGDALTLTVKREAQGVPGMVFSPLPEFTVAGLSTYPDAPEVNDHVDRGSLTGIRTDSTTYLFENEGDYTIPSLDFQWWDPAKEVLSAETIPETIVSVIANPAFASHSTDAVGWNRPALNWVLIAGAFGLVLVFAFLLKTALPYLQAQRREKARIWLRTTLRRMVLRVIRVANDLPPLNPLAAKDD